MVDNVGIVTGIGAEIATDQQGDGSHVQWVKLMFGADGSFVAANAANPLPVADVFTDGEALVDEEGTGGVLIFTFSSPMDLIWVRSIGGAARADPFGGNPDAQTGIYCADDEPTPLTIRTTVVKVYAEPSVVVSVWGFRA